MRVTRGPETESVHHARGVIVGLRPREEVQFGEPETLGYWRSSMKPFQSLPLVEDGAAEAAGFEAGDLALCCASHHGTPDHVRRARRMLRGLGLEEEALVCGPHLPCDAAATRALQRRRREPTRFHNNCSGKHIGMLALALHHGWPTEGYAEFEHPVQERIRTSLEEWLDVSPSYMSWARDGCGVPTPFLSLRQMARAYARLARAARSDDGPAAAVVGAMTGRPEIVGGPTAVSTRVMEATSGRLLAKEGAEGVFCVGCPEGGWGAALKVADGSKRGVGPALVEMLAAAGLLEPAELDGLAELRSPAVLNTEGREVGRMVAEAEPHRATVAGRVGAPRF